MFGFLNIYKPKGMTSHDVVSVLRRISKVKRIGHTGTLDPFAEGVLPICVGKSTRLIEYLKDDKAYIGTVKLGEATTTYDTEGEITKTCDKTVSLKNIKTVLENFRGNIEQIPPIYSAIKVQGKKLYEYARNGETVEIKPRTVTIQRLDILKYDEIKKELELFIECSKGTYIRSLANDIGDALGTYGHLNKLIRVKAGDFVIENTVQLGEIQAKEDITKYLLNPLDYLDYPKYEVSEPEYTRILNGNSIKTNLTEGIIILTAKHEIIATAKTENGITKPQKVFI